MIAGGIYYANIGQKVSIVELVSAKTAAVVRFPEAIATVYTLKQTLVGATADELTATGSVQSNEPVTWVISSETAATQNSIAIVFTFNNETDAASLQTYLSDNIDTTLIKEVTVGEGEDNNQVTVEYEIA